MGDTYSTSEQSPRGQKGGSMETPLLIQCTDCTGTEFDIEWVDNGACGDPECCGAREIMYVEIRCKNCGAKSRIHND